LGLRLSMSGAASSMAAWGALLDFTEAKIAARSTPNWALGIAAIDVGRPRSGARVSSPAKFADKSLPSKEAFTRRPFSSLQDRAAPNTRNTCAMRHLERTSPTTQEDCAGPGGRAALYQREGRQEAKTAIMALLCLNWSAVRRRRARDYARLAEQLHAGSGWEAGFFAFVITEARISLRLKPLLNRKAACDAGQRAS